VDASADRADVVLVGYDKTLTWEKAAQACRMIAKGATFLATHPDVFVPTDEGNLPDCGSMCAMIEAASGVAPKYLGKPWTLGLPLIEQITGISPEQMCMIGDRLDTDVEFGNRAGMVSLLALTGATSAEQAERATGEQTPDVVVPHLGVLTDIFN
jgi:HAD superfamily hydrolase (TIGR01450 family)